MKSSKWPLVIRGKAKVFVLLFFTIDKSVFSQNLISVLDAPRRAAIEAIYALSVAIGRTL